jgi:Nitrous oxide-stimulated promoter
VEFDGTIFLPGLMQIKDVFPPGSDNSGRWRTFPDREARAMTEQVVSEQAASKPLRITRERRTIEAMIGIYCRDHHAAAGLCPECRELLDYATCRLSRCPFGAEKPACARCPIHCYKPQMRERVKAVMRYAGPRMLYRHPILAVLHQWDAWRNRAPEGKALGK